MNCLRDQWKRRRRPTNRMASQVSTSATVFQCGRIVSEMRSIHSTTSPSTERFQEVGLDQGWPRFRPLKVTVGAVHLDVSLVTDFFHFRSSMKRNIARRFGIGRLAMD